MYKKILQKSGISNLVPIIVISAVTLLAVTTSAMIIIDETKTGLHQSKSLETFTAADSCMEEALLKIKENPSYNGEILTIENSSCTITISGSGNTRTINAETSSISVNTYSHEIESQITLSPFEITSWQEINT